MQPFSSARYRLFDPYLPHGPTVTIPHIGLRHLLTHSNMSEPFHIIPAASETPLFLFGDHASRHIPARYDSLGLSGDDLTRHIAWDIGTEAVLRTLCQRFELSLIHI